MTSTRTPAATAVRAQPQPGRRLAEAERWFVRQGLPRLRRAPGRGDTVTRMAPVLGLLGIVHWIPADLPEVLVICMVAAAAVPLRHWIGGRLRSPLARLTAVACVCLYGSSTRPIVEGLRTAIETRHLPQGLLVWTTVVLLGAGFALAYLCTAFGLVPLAGRALLHALGDLRNGFQLQARSMPMLLFLTLFFFFTGELWQLAGRLTWQREALVIAIFAIVTVFASGARLREEIAQIEDGLSAEAVITACRGTPLEGSAACRAGWRAAPLSRLQNLNLLFLLASRQLVQAVVVGVGMFAFFVTLGLVLIDPHTMQEWIGAPPQPSALVPAVPAELVRVSLLLAGFSSMYFAFSAMVDPNYRKQFFPPVIRELERVLAVRAVYLTLARGGS
ncbi:hypothetical protein [Thermoactinospora rubra]|uniref:hypothetical protein n=1 Tax=Thermoactinospora rubra TaxID=1088767 RepID=UPI000A111EA6|nr:hypothetical protein [Thermoactinospora rubra]